MRYGVPVSRYTLLSQGWHVSILRSFRCVGSIDFDVGGVQMGKTLLEVKTRSWSLAKRLLSDGCEGFLMLPPLGTAAGMGRDGSWSWSGESFRAGEWASELGYKGRPVA